MVVLATDMVMLLEGLGFSLMVTLKSLVNAPLVAKKVSLPLSLYIYAHVDSRCVFCFYDGGHCSGHVFYFKFKSVCWFVQMNVCFMILNQQVIMYQVFN